MRQVDLMIAALFVFCQGLLCGFALYQVFYVWGFQDDAELLQVRAAPCRRCRCATDAAAVFACTQAYAPLARNVRRVFFLATLYPPHPSRSARLLAASMHLQFILTAARTLSLVGCLDRTFSLFRADRAWYALSGPQKLQVRPSSSGCREPPHHSPAPTALDHGCLRELHCGAHCHTARQQAGLLAARPTRGPDRVRCIARMQSVRRWLSSAVQARAREQRGCFGAGAAAVASICYCAAGGRCCGVAACLLGAPAPHKPRGAACTCSPAAAGQDAYRVVESLRQGAKRAALLQEELIDCKQQCVPARPPGRAQPARWPSAHAVRCCRHTECRC